MDNFEKEGTTENFDNLGGDLTNMETPEPSLEIPDLEKVGKFRYQGEEWDLKRFNSERLMQQDYTRKTQALSQERKLLDALPYDLEELRNNPHRIDEFKRIYPEKFHWALKYVQNQANDAKGTSKGNPENNELSELRKHLSELDSFRQEVMREREEALESQLDNIYSEMGSKYPMAGQAQELVSTRAQAYLNRKIEDARLNGEDPTKVGITKKEWDAIFKNVHEWLGGITKANVKSENLKQRQMNQKGRDIGSGGGIPGNKKREPKTMDEAKRMALQDLTGSSFE